MVCSKKVVKDGPDDGTAIQIVFRHFSPLAGWLSGLPRP